MVKTPFPGRAISSDTPDSSSAKAGFANSSHGLKGTDRRSTLSSGVRLNRVAVPSFSGSTAQLRT